MKIQLISSDAPQIQVNKLYSLENVRDCYYVTKYNLVMNIQSFQYCSINCTHQGYLYVTLGIAPEGSNNWRKVSLHKIIALARINNGPYKCIEHINDNTFDLSVSNLKFSTQQANALSAFRNGKHVCQSNIFRVVLFDGSEYVGTFKEIEALSGIPKATLYYRYMNGSVDYPTRPNQKVKYIEHVGIDMPSKNITNRSIDYRNDFFEDTIFLDNVWFEKGTK